MSGVEFVVMALAIVTGLLARWWNYHRPARQGEAAKAAQQPVVGIAVRGPVMPVPNLMDAYRALPPHCHGGSGQ